MKHIPVNLHKKTVKNKGKRYIYWVLRWTGIDGKPKMHHVARVDGQHKLSRRQAMKKCEQKETEVNKDPLQQYKKLDTLSIFLEKYLEARKHELTPGTQTLHKATAKYMAAFFATDPQIDQITKQQAREFKTALANGLLTYVSQRPKRLAPGTIDGHMRNARTMFNLAIADELIATNPFSHLCRTIINEKDWHYVTANEYTKISDAAPSVEWQLLFALCRLAGLRQGEALNLEWGNVDWRQNTILVISKENWKTKSRRSRKVPMCPELQALLSAADPDDNTSQRMITGDLFKNNLWRDFQNIRKDAKVDQYKKPFHAMRKSCAQDWADNNVPPNSLQHWMGHTKFETTMDYYLKASESEYKRAAETAFFKKDCAKPVQNAENEKC